MNAETRYAQSGELYVAYQVTGEGPLDVVMAPGFVSHVEHDWEEPRVAHYLERLGSFCRLIRFDKRGTGMSDRDFGCPSLEQRMDDVRAVMDAEGIEVAALFGYSEGAVMAATFAAMFPERVCALIIYGSMAKFEWSEDYPWALTADVIETMNDLIGKEWGKAVTLPFWAPSLADDERFKQWWARLERQGGSPGSARELLAMNQKIDIREVLPTIHVPTLVLHRTGDLVVPIDGGRYVAGRIPDSKFVELPGDDHAPFVGDADGVVAEISEFLTGARTDVEHDRILATVMFTDIVRSTELATELGDHAWKDLIESHHERVRKQLDAFRGREIDTAGDGFLASFDGPARGVKCAVAVVKALNELGIEIRAGLHTGECEVIGEKLGGLAVHLGARVMSKAGDGEVYVSSTVKDLVAGSGLEFEDRGEETLKGIPGQWRLYSVVQ